MALSTQLSRIDSGFQRFAYTAQYYSASHKIIVYTVPTTKNLRQAPFPGWKQRSYREV